MAAVTYTTLVAPKGTAGSILNWVGYGKIDVDTCLAESQSLIYSMLRVREMRFQWVFGIPAGNCKALLPARFLDPIGTLKDQNGTRYAHKSPSEVKEGYTFDTSLSGTFGNNPFTTGAVGSGTVTVALANHGINQGSDITIPGAIVVDGVLISGTSLVTAVIDANTLQIAVEDAAAIVGGVNGGGAGVTYTANNLIAGIPARWSIWSGYAQFDGAFVNAAQFRLLVYKSLPLLSASNTTNFLTDRYPRFLRKACMAAAADFMKDDGEYTKHVNELSAMIQSIAAEGDLEYRGADLTTDTPGDNYDGR